MARSCRRLLAAWSQIFSWTVFTSLIFISLIFEAPTLLHGQRVGIPRAPDPSPRYPQVPGNGDFQKLVFRQLVHSAGTIFAGRVVFIGHSASSLRPNPACTTITFQVEDAIRGTSRGQNLTIREWAGLWASGERYRVGERVLLFLYSPSELGLTSPVSGTMGKFMMNTQGQVVMNAQHVATFAGDPVLAGKPVVPYAEFARAVRRFMREE
jgi:hypothetical protein